jgi:ABC-2 type transport system permease protein
MSLRATRALMRASWLVAKSYRVSMLISLGGLAFTIVPVYFVAGALQPLMAKSISGEAEQYFGFILLGTIMFSFLSTSLTALPSAIRGGIGSGFFEALMATPAGLPSILAGQIGYSFVWTAIRGTLLLLVGWMLGAHVAWARVPEAMLIVVLIVAAYLAIGLVGGALILSFRTMGPLPQGVLVLSGLFGGVYYPTKVIPESIQAFSGLMPLTYGLRALRRVLLEGFPLSAVIGDVSRLALFAIVLTAIGVTSLHLALRFARRAGSLAHY